MATLEGLNEYRRVVVAPPSDASPSLLEMAQLKNYEVRPASRPIDVLRALVPFFFRYRRIDVISTSVAHNLICLWLARIFFVRLRQLNVVHGGSDERYSYAKKFRLNKVSVGIVAVSRFVKRRLAANGVVEDKVVVVENFLTGEDVRARPRRVRFDASHPGSRPLDPSRIRVAVVSRLDPFKRLDVLFDAVTGSDLRNFVFDIYGTGELLAPLRTQAQALGGRITLHGYDRDIGRRLAQADLFLHVCPDEPFGLVVLEAFAAGVPVIVPRSGGTDELVEDGVTGFKVDPVDPLALAARLRAMATLTGQELDDIVEAGRRVLESRFGAARGAEAYRRALRDMGPR